MRVPWLKFDTASLLVGRQTFGLSLWLPYWRNVIDAMARPVRVSWPKFDTASLLVGRQTFGLFLCPLLGTRRGMGVVFNFN